MNILKKLVFLHDNPAFCALSDEELLVIAEAARVRRLAPKEVLIGESLSARYVCIVVSGYLVGTSGARYGERRIVGLRQILFDEPYDEKIYAPDSEEVVVMQIPKGQFYTILWQCPELVIGLIRHSDPLFMTYSADKAAGES